MPLFDRSTYDSLFTLHRDCVPILYRFRDIAGYVSTVEKFSSRIFGGLVGGDCTKISPRYLYKKTIVPKLSCSMVVCVMTYSYGSRLIVHRVVPYIHRHTQRHRASIASIARYKRGDLVCPFVARGPDQ